MAYPEERRGIEEEGYSEATPGPVKGRSFLPYAAILLGAMVVGLLAACVSEAGALPGGLPDSLPFVGTSKTPADTGAALGAEGTAGGVHPAEAFREMVAKQGGYDETTSEATTAAAGEDGNTPGEDENSASTRSTDPSGPTLGEPSRATAPAVPVSASSSEEPSASQDAPSTSTEAAPEASTTPDTSKEEVAHAANTTSPTSSGSTGTGPASSSSGSGSSDTAPAEDSTGKGAAARPATSTGGKEDTKPTGREAADPASSDSASSPPADKTLYLTVPKLGIYGHTVRNDGSEAALDLGAIKLPETGFPWEKEANTYMACHRLGWPGAQSYNECLNLPSMQKGDEISLADANGTVYEYRVTETREISPMDRWITDPVKGKSLVSLQTCIESKGDYATLGPNWSARFVVRAERV